MMVVAHIVVLGIVWATLSFVAFLFKMQRVALDKPAKKCGQRRACRPQAVNKV